MIDRNFMGVSFDFQRQHVLPNDLLAASQMILPVGRFLFMRGLSFYIGKPSDIFQYGFFSPFIHILDTSPQKNILLTMIYEQSDGKLYEVEGLDFHEVKLNVFETAEDVFNRCSAIDFNANLGFIRNVVATHAFEKGVYYVYRHIFPDGRVYFGKGKDGRINIKSRNNYYNGIIENNVDVVMDKICGNISEDLAYKIEKELIEKARYYYGAGFVINVTSGLERVQDVGDMPIRTMQVLNKYKSIKFEDPRFLQTVNIFMRFSEEVGSAKMYFEDISVFDAAKRIGCTMNDVIAVQQKGGGSIGIYKVLTNDEIKKEIERP